MKPYYLAATFIGIAAVTVILGALLVITSSKKLEVNNNYVPTQTQVVTKPVFSPTPVPLAESQTDSTLSQTDTDIQATLNQTSQDLGEINNIDASQDAINL